MKEIIDIVREVLLEISQRAYLAKHDKGEGTIHVFKDIANYRLVEKRQQWISQGKRRKYWVIYDDNNSRVGTIDDAGRLRYNNGSDMWEDADRPFTMDEKGLKNAARYIYLYRQQYLLSNKKNKKKLEEIKIQDTIEFPDVKGYTATAVTKTGVNTFDWTIKNNDNGIVGQLEPDGTLWYVGQDGKSYELADNNFKDDLKNAVRYIFLMRQKPVGTLKEEKERTTYDDIGGFYIEKAKGYLNVYNDKGVRVGEISDKTIHYPTSPVMKDLGDPHSVYLDKHESIDRFGRSQDGLKNMVRFLYLNWDSITKQGQEDFNLYENVQKGLKIPVPEIKGWSVLEHKTDSMIPWWDIFDEDDSWVGYFAKRSGVYRLYYENTNGNMEHVDQDLGTNYVNAVRYVFLHRQKPIGK